MQLGKLLKGTGAKIDARLAKINIRSVTTNSKNVKKNSLFVAIKGRISDGHCFTRAALKKGAISCVVEKGDGLIRVRDTRKALSVIAKNFYNSPSEKLKLIGITGTNGKTTTSFLIESIFRESGIPCGLIGTIEYRFGARALPAVRTTPDALSVNALLDHMLKNKFKAAVMEVSSHALDQGRVDGIFFDTAIFTNLSHEHLDYHGDMKKYFRSKIKIFKNLKKNGIAIINADDKKANRIKKALNCKRITYGLKAGADVAADLEEVGPGGSRFTVKTYGKRRFFVETNLMGRHNISNILAATASCLALGIKPGKIKKGIEKVRRVTGRLEPVRTGQGFNVFVDYAHTHDALERTLKFLKGIKKGRLITLFGCGGDRDKEKRPMMGRVAQRFSDFTVLTSDNPRSENPERIIKDIERGMDKEKGNYSVVVNRQEAIEKALKNARKGDIVLLTGKGHEALQFIGKRSIPFSDKKVAKEILKKL